MSLSVKEIVEQALKDGGYDGLYLPGSNCACCLDNLMACGYLEGDCKMGYKIVPPEDVYADYDFYVCDTKDAKPWEDEG